MNVKHLSKTLKHLVSRVMIPAAAFLAISAHAAQPLKIGYSDWPGWVAWQVAIDKGWFKEAGVAVDFEWFDYSASMDAFSAGKIDAVTMTDAKPGLTSLKDLKGKKVAVEQGLVEHLLLLDGLKKAGMKESDVKLVNAKTNEMPQVLASGDVAAIGAWQPIAGQAMKAVPGSRPVYTSANEPGLIYDALAVNPSSAKQRKAEWLKVVKVWDRVVQYINDPQTQPDAVKIMAARVGVTPQVYLPLLKGTHLLSLADGRKVYVKAAGFGSLYGSSKVADDFNVANGVYKAHQDIDSYIDPSFTNAK